MDLFSKQTALLGYHKPPLRVVTGATVMNPSTQVFLHVALLCCLVTTSIGGITDLQKVFSQGVTGRNQVTSPDDRTVGEETGTT